MPCLYRVIGQCIVAVDLWVEEEGEADEIGITQLDLRVGRERL